MATIEGRTEAGVAQGITRNPDTYAELFAFVMASEVPAGWRQYRVRPLAEARYAVPVWLRGDPQAALGRVGLGSALVEVMQDAADPDVDVTVPPDIWEQAMSRVPGGVLPLSPRWLVDNVPDMFPSVRSAERAIKTAKSELTTDKRHIRYTSIWGMSVVSAVLAVYRLTGQKRPSACLIKPDVVDPRTQLGRLLDAVVVEFRMLATPDERPAATGPTNAISVIASATDVVSRTVTDAPPETEAGYGDLLEPSAAFPIRPFAALPEEGFAFSRKVLALKIAGALVMMQGAMAPTCRMRVAPVDPYDWKWAVGHGLPY